MNNTEFVVIIVFVVIVIMLFHKIKYRNRVYVESDVDNRYYLVRNRADKKSAANLLANIRISLQKVIDHIVHKVQNNKNEQGNSLIFPYIDKLRSRFLGAVITESPEDSRYTSYCINKGDEIVFCIRPKYTMNMIESSSLHDINLVMYVGLHEISHIACPERDHTTLFKQIFYFICKNAIEIGAYKRINFLQNPIEYCGMTIYESII